MTQCALRLLHGIKIMTHAETVPSWLLLNFKSASTYMKLKRFKTRAAHFQYNAMGELVCSGQFWAAGLDCFHRHSMDQDAGGLEKFTSTAGGFCMCSMPFL